MSTNQQSSIVRQTRRALFGRARVAGGFLLLGGLLPAVPACAAGVTRGPSPVARIELESMGFQGLQPEFMVAGSPMLTVNFVDQKHLLVTFEVRRLMKRELDAGPNEADRTIMACLVELPTGTVVARTEWRLHDRSQYLWSLGSGRFMLRVHDELSVFAPMAGRPEDAFRMSPFLLTDRHVMAVLLSPDHDLLTVESTKRPDSTAGNIEVHVGPDPMPVQINFYRLKTEDADHDRLMAVSAGAVRTRVAVSLPVTTAGYLDILEGGKSTFLFNFDVHGGKVQELLAFDTTCFPRPVFVGHSEFVVFGCKGGDERKTLAAFNLHGEEMWQQGFYESYVGPTFAFAPASGRFALGRTLVALPLPDEISLTSTSVTSQDVRVYQTYNGRQLLHIDCSPVERAGQNFDLSPDGMQLAVIREVEVRHKGTKAVDPYTSKSPGVELYALPALTEQDRSAVQAAAITAPPDTGAAIDEALARIAALKSSRKAENSIGEAVPATDKALPPAGADQPPAPAGQPIEPDANAVQPEEPRKPPTLYSPDEKPEHK